MRCPTTYSWARILPRPDGTTRCEVRNQPQGAFLKSEQGKVQTCFSKEIMTIANTSLWDASAELATICADVIQAIPGPEEVHPAVINIK